MKISEVIARKSEVAMGGKAPEDRPRKPVAQRALKVIRTRETPNPNALQFVLNTQVLEKRQAVLCFEGGVQRGCDGDGGVRL